MLNRITYVRSGAALFVPHLPARNDFLFMLNRNTHGVEYTRPVESGSEPAGAKVHAAKK